MSNYLDYNDLPLDICTWGVNTDNPCLISYKVLNHTHRHMDPRPILMGGPNNWESWVYGERPIEESTQGYRP